MVSWNRHDSKKFFSPHIYSLYLTCKVGLASVVPKKKVTWADAGALCRLTRTCVKIYHSSERLTSLVSSPWAANSMKQKTFGLEFLESKAAIQTKQRTLSTVAAALNLYKCILVRNWGILATFTKSMEFKILQQHNEPTKLFFSLMFSQTSCSTSKIFLQCWHVDRSWNWKHGCCFSGWHTQ